MQMNSTLNERKKISRSKLTQFLTEASDISVNTYSPKTINLRQALTLYLSMYLSEPTTLEKHPKQNLVDSIKQLSKISYVPKTKGRLCGGLLMKGEKAYKCHECMTEQNSVLCQKCFQLDKHIGHDFQRFQVFGGCCDCGDIQKWKEEGFCIQHSKDQEIEITLDSKILKDFLQEHAYAFQLLLDLYNKFFAFEIRIAAQQWNFPLKPLEQKAKDQTIAGIIKIIDFYGSNFFEELVQFNKAGKFANAMTNQFFDLQLNFTSQVYQKTKFIQKDVFSCLFSMLKLKEVPQKICDLCITLFPMVDFRQRVTLKYLQYYIRDHTFPTSHYTHLSSQLLTSYLVITKLIKQKRIHALCYYPVCRKEEDAQKLAEGFVRYYYDIKYLSKLYGEASLIYFKLHAQEKKFVNLGEYRIVLNKFPRSIDYYGLEQIFLDRMLFVIKVIQKDRSQQLSRSVMRQLYEFITTDRTHDYNKFRPQERFWVMVVFTKMRGDLSLLDQDKFMKNLFNQLGVKNFKTQVEHLLKNFSSVIEKAAEIIENNTEVQGNFTFFSFYLKKSQKLFNLDALLLKILYKMASYYNRTERADIRIDQILINHRYGPQLLQSESLSFGCLDSSFQQQGEQTKLFKAIKLLKEIKNYISFILQCIFSDLPQLSLMCALQPTQKELKQQKGLIPMPLEHLALHYYQQLLESQQTSKVSIKTFKAVCQLFFKEEQVFKLFVAKHKDPIDGMRLVKPKQSNPKISEAYFRSLNSLPANKYMIVSLPPYCKWEKNIQVDHLVHTIDLTVDLIQRANRAQLQFRDRIELQDLYLKDSQMDLQLKGPKQYKVGDLPQLVVELWKMTLLTQPGKAQKLLNKLLKKEWISKSLVALGNDLVNKIINEASKEASLASEQQKKQLQKKRLMEKKNLLKQKMAKNAEKILLRQPEKMQEENQNGQLCNLCKDKRQDQNLCLLGFVAFTSQNICSNAEKSQKAMPLFGTCGHAVHISCLVGILNKHSINKVYSVCPLCKNATNIQIPLKQHYDSKDRDQLYLGLKKVYNTVEYQFNEDHLDQILRSSLAYQLLFKGYLLPQAFQKNIHIYRIIYNIYRQSQFQNSANVSIENILNQSQLVKAFKFLQFLLGNHQQSKHISYYLHLGFSQNFLNKGFQLLNKLKAQTLKDITTFDSPEIHSLRTSILLPSLQKNLASMNSKHRGKCQQCGLITNQQVICLNCPNFVTCLSCQKIKPPQHSREFHLGVNVFVKTATGEVIYFMRNRFWRFPSLYEDYMGRGYSNTSQQRQDYELNTAKLQQVKKDIYLCRVEQKVRYKENETKQVNHQETF